MVALDNGATGAQYSSAATLGETVLLGDTDGDGVEGVVIGIEATVTLVAVDFVL